MLEFKNVMFSAAAFIALQIALTTTCYATIYGNQQGNVNFPGGISSFADAVVSYTPGTGGLTTPYMNTGNAIGAPDYFGGTNYVSLGSGGSIILRFTDNSLTGSGTTALDLWVFEIGPDVEDTFVAISKNGTNWFEVGKVFGSTSGIDIDAYGFGTADFFSYVKLTDDRYEGATYGDTVGADIDAVGAITTAPPVSAVPEPSTLLLLGGGLGALALLGRKSKR